MPKEKSWATFNYMYEVRLCYVAGNDVPNSLWLISCGALPMEDYNGLNGINARYCSHVIAPNATTITMSFIAQLYVHPTYMLVSDKRCLHNVMQCNRIPQILINLIRDQIVLTGLQPAGALARKGLCTHPHQAPITQVIANEGIRHLIIKWFAYLSSMKG